MLKVEVKYGDYGWANGEHNLYGKGKTEKAEQTTCQKKNNSVKTADYQA